MTAVWKDPIIEELHQIRAQLAKQHGNDLHKIVQYYQQREAASTHPKVSFPPRRPMGWVPSAGEAPKSKGNPL